MGVKERYEERIRKREQEKSQQDATTLPSGVAERYELRSFISSLPTRVEDWNNSTTELQNSYTTRFFDKDGNFINSYRGDTGTVLSSFEDSKSAYESETKYLLDGLDKYGHYLDADTVKAIQDQLGKGSEYINYIYNAYQQDHDYYSQWEDEAAYTRDMNNYQYSQKYAKATYADLQKAKKTAEGQELEWLEAHDTDMQYVDTMTNTELKAYSSEVKKLEQDVENLRKTKTSLELSGATSDPYYITVCNNLTAAENALNKSSVLYFDHANEAVTADTLLRVRGNEAILANLEKDSESKGIYDTISSLNSDSDKLNDVIDILTAYSSNGMTMDYLSDEQRSLIEEMGAKYGINTTNVDVALADANKAYSSVNTEMKSQKKTLEANGYSWDDLEYHKEWVANKDKKIEQQKKDEEYAQKHPILATANNILLAPMQIVDLADNLIDTAKYGYASVSDDTYINRSETYNSTVSEMIDTDVYNAVYAETGNQWLSETTAWLASGAYSGATSAAQSALTTAGCKVLFGPAGTGIALSIMGTEAAASSYHNAILNGSTNGEAILTATASGLAEAAFEKISLDSLLDIGKMYDVSSMSALLKSMVKNSGATFMQGATEASEEFLTEITNKLADEIINGNHSAYNTAVSKYTKMGYSYEDACEIASKDVINDILTSLYGGFIGGVGSGGFASMTQGAIATPTAIMNQNLDRAYNTMQGQNIVDNGQLSQLVTNTQNLGKMKGSKSLQSLANKVSGANIEATDTKGQAKYVEQVGKLYKGVQQAQLSKIAKATKTETEVNSFRELVKAELKAAGVQNVDKAADVIVESALNSGKLTREESSLFNSVKGRTIIDKVLRSDELQLDKDSEFEKVREEYKTTKEIARYDSTRTLRTEKIRDLTGYDTTDGATRVEASGEEVEIKSIESFTDDDARVKLDNGDTISVAELTVNNDVAVIINGLKMLHDEGMIDVPTANYIMELASGTDMDAEAFMLAAADAISLGSINYGEILDTDINTRTLPENIRKELFKKGQEYSKQKAESKSATLEKERSENTSKAIEKSKKEKKEIDEYKVRKAGNVTFKNVKFKDLNKEQKAQVRLLEVVFAEIGLNVEFFASPIVNGRRDGVNGSYDRATNTVRIDVFAGNGGEGLMLFTASHELTHFIREWSPAKFKVFADFLIERYAAKDIPIKDLINKKIEQSQKMAEKYPGRKVLTYDAAYEEVVADACESFLRDSNVKETLVALAEQDATLVEKVIRWIQDFTKLIKDALDAIKGKAPESKESAYVLEDLQNDLEKLHELWDEALIDARENLQWVESSKAEKNTTIEGDEKMQYRGLNDEGIEVYETSEKLKSLSLKERKELLIDAIRNEYVGRTAKFNKNGTVYYATLDTVSARKSLYGDKKSDKKGYKAKINIGADGNYFELVENALYDSSKDEVGKTTNTDIHDNVAQWDYYIKTVISDGRYFKVLINVADKGNNQYVYDVSLKEIKKGETSSSSNATFNQEVTPDNSISNLAKNVNTNDGKFQDRAILQNSLRSLNEEYTHLKKDVEAIKQTSEYLKFLEDLSILEGDELDKVLNDYGKWSREVGLFAKTKRISEIENEQRNIEKKIRDDTALRREEFFKSIENMHEIEKMEYVDKAIERYGTTDRVSLASYLMLNGEMLDFSEGQGYRVEDHRAISEILDMAYDYEYSDGLIAFMNMGNIRMQTYGIDISQSPNYEQKSTLRDIISQVMQDNDEFTVDFSNTDGHTEGSVTYPRGTSSSKILSDIEDYFKTGVVPEYDSGISDFLYSDRVINESMTMEQAKLMIQKAFVLGGIYDWYDGEYKNGDDWIRAEGASEVALYIESEYSLMDKYFNDNQAYIDGDIYVNDVLEAYLAGTLVGKQAEKATRLDVSKGYNVTDNRFYAPKKYNDIKTLWETANAKVTKANKAQVNEARKSFLFAAHDSDVAAELGISASEVNKKLRSWSNYSANAKDISTRLNNGVAESNQWSGIQNCSILSQISVTDEDISSMVKEIKGTSSEYQRNYIAKTMLALNTHIDWSELIFDFKKGFVDENRRSVRGLYENSKRTITIGGSSHQNTVAHEMGHALDYKWQRDLFGEHAYNNALTDNHTRLDLIEGGEEAQQFYKNFRNFIKSLTDVNVNYSAYTMDAGEVFARFVAKFVEWVNVTANSNTFRESDFYGDKFTGSQYIEFVKLLQEKSKLDSKRMSENVKFQDRDSTGRELSPEQVEFFKDSKVRDENGNLLVVRHGTDADFNIFDFSKVGKNGTAEGYGFYFSDDKEITNRYGGNQIEVYLNITKPMFNNKRTVTKKELTQFVNALIDFNIEKYKDDELIWQDSFISNYVNTYEGGMSRGYAVQQFVNQIWEYNDNDQDLIFEVANADGDFYDSDSAKEFYGVLAKSIGYDGIIAEWEHADGTSKVYVTFESKQSKRTSNLNPTDNEDIRYQDRAYTPSLEELGLKTENEKLKKDVTRLNELLKLQKTLTHGTIFTAHSVNKEASKLMKTFGMHKGKEEFAKKLHEFYSFIAKSEELSWQEVSSRAENIAKWVDEQIPERNVREDYADTILKDIRSSNISLDDVQKAEVAYKYGSYNAYRKSHFGSVNLTNDGIKLDSIWQTWSADYPNIFDENANSVDMPILLADIIEDLKTAYVVTEQFEESEKMNWMVEELYDSYWNVSTYQTLADKHQKQITDLKIKHKEDMAALREQRDAAVLKTKEQYKEHYQDMIQRIRADKDAKLKDYKERVQEQRKKNVEGRNKTALKNKIKNVVKQLDSLYNNGTKERNVKIDLRDTVEKALILADVLFDNGQVSNYQILTGDITTRLSEEEKKLVNEWRLAHKQREDFLARIEAMEAKFGKDMDIKAHQALLNSISYANKKMSSIEKKLSGMFERQRGELEDNSVKNAINALTTAYKSMEESKISYVQAAYSEYVYKRLDALRSEVQNTKVKNMTLMQLQEVYDAYKMVLTSIRTSNEVFLKNKRMSVEDMGTRVIDEVKKIGKTKEERNKIEHMVSDFSWKELKPIFAFERIGSKTFLELYNEARKGEDTFARDVDDAKQYINDRRTKYGYDSWDMDKTYEFKLADGRIFSITLQELMSIYAYSKREQALDHISDGGFVFNNTKFFLDKREKGLKGKIEKVRTTEKAYRLGVDELVKVVNSLTDNQKKYVDEMQDYLSEVMGAKGNEVSRVLYGIDLFKEKYYFPLVSSKDFIFAANNPAGEIALRNSGMTKATVPHARNPIVLDNFDDVWSSHVNKMSLYHSFVLPIENLNKVHNYTGYARNDESYSVSSVLSGVFGNPVNDYISGFIKDLNGGVVSQGATSPFSKMFTNFKKTAVAASTSVVVQQPTAVLRAMAMINPKYFKLKSDMFKPGEAWEEIKKYAPVAILKEIGGFDVGGGKQIADYIMENSHYKGKDKAKAFFTDSAYRDKTLMSPAGKADEIGWNIIWSAVQQEIKDTTTLNVGSEEFYNACGERFTEVITYTQVYDSVFSRSAYMRSKNDITKMATAFMGEPTTSFNMMYNAVLQAKRGSISKGKAIGVVGATISSIVLAAVAKSFIYALRDDDEDESYAEKYLASLADSLASDLFIPNMIPFVKDITSMLQGWDVERTDMAVFKDIKDAFDDWDSSTKSTYRKVEDILGAVAALFGIPLGNVMRTGREIYNAIANIFDDNYLEPGDVGDAVFGETTVSDVNEALEKGNTEKAKNLVNKIIEDKMKSGKTEKEAKAAVKSSVTSYWKPLYIQAYKDNNSAEMLRIRKILQSLGIYDSVPDTCSDWIKSIKNEKAETETKFKKW